jgi:hypothetical protein
MVETVRGESVTFKFARDVLILGAGLTCILSQIVYQFQGGAPSFPVMAIGASLLAGYPLVRIGDHAKGIDPP